jgi:hypothetical protein
MEADFAVELTTSLWHDAGMHNTVAIVIAGALIALALAVSNRWQISAAPAQVYRLDRWTGHVDMCVIISTENGVTMVIPGSKVPCE